MMLISLLLTIGQHAMIAGDPDPDPPPAAAVENVLVILVDDLGAADRPLVTNLSALADEGMTFHRFYTWPVCSPSRLAFTLGRYPRRACARDSLGHSKGVGNLSMNPHLAGDDKLINSIPTVYDLFSSTHAVSLVGKWHIGRAAGSSNTQSGPPSAGVEEWLAGIPAVPNAGGGTGYYSWWRVDGGVMALSTEYATDAAVASFLTWWNATSGAKFCVLSLPGVHYPWDPPPGASPTGTLRGDYEQMIADLNQTIADVMAAVSLDDTLVVFTSDNGTPDNVRPAEPSGRWKGSTYEGGVNVPLVVAGPGVVHGETNRLVSMVDLPATLAEVSGLSIQSGFVDSVSFADALGTWAGATPRSFVFTERYEVEVTGAEMPQAIGYDSQCVVESSWKLQRTDDDGDGTFLDRWSYVGGGSEQLLTPPQSVRDRLISELTTIPPRE